MEKHLFLTGPTGCGKTTLLRRALGGRLAEAGGLVTQASCGVHGELTGFALSPAASAAGIPGFTPETYLDCTRFPPRADTEVWRGTGVRLLEEDPNARIVEVSGPDDPLAADALRDWVSALP